MGSYYQEKYAKTSLVESLKKLRSRSSKGFSSLSKENDSTSNERLYIEIFSYSLLRKEKIEILYLIAKTGKKRAVEFLIHFVMTDDNVSMVSEAVLALGKTKDLMAFSFLLSLLKNKESLYRREALIALSENPLVPFEKSLYLILNDKDESSSLKAQAIISCSYLLKEEDFSFVESVLDSSFSTNSMVFNSALLAAEKIAGKKHLEKIKSFDLKHRFFAKELQKNIVQRIESKSFLSKESLVHILKEISFSNKDFLLKSSSLKSFTREEIFSCKDFNSLDIEKKANIYLFFRKEDKFNEDLDFFIKEKENISSSLLSCFIFYALELEKSSDIKTLFQGLDLEKKLEILSLISYDKSLEFFIKELNSSKSSKDQKIQLLNSLSHQFFMNSFQESEIKSLEVLLVDQLKKSKEADIRARALRLLVDFKMLDEESLAIVKVLYESGKVDRGSFFLFLKSLDTQETVSLVVKEIKDCLSKKEVDFPYFLMTILAQSKQELNIDLSFMSPDLMRIYQIPILKMLAAHKVSACFHLIEEGLTSEFQDIIILSLKAFQKNQILSKWSLVRDLALNEKAPLQDFALETLALSTSFQEHEFLFENFIFKKNSTVDLVSLFHMINPIKDENCRPLLDKLKRKLIDREEPFDQEEVFSSAISFMDDLSSKISENFSSAIKKNEEHDLDEKIKVDIKEYSDFSPVVKSVLRNAELTWDRKDLFDSLVDKSTMIIEYTKSIEILIQERLGEPFFHSKEELLKALQKRVCSLRLNEPYIKADEIIDRLSCSSFFSRKNFPKAKFSLLIKSILSGNFCYDQYRVLDGLRAWSLMLLIFFRDFRSLGTDFKSFVTFDNISSKEIESFANSLNELQEVRNIAAHRGTLLNLSKISEVRKQSFLLLSSFSALLKDKPSFSFSNKIQKRKD